MDNPLVTVFIPAYNCENYIQQTLTSITEQTYAPLDILVIDDGSTDNTLKIIQSSNDDRIRVLRNNKNMGIPFTRNRGIREAKGKYLVIMDSDDLSERERVSKQVNFLERNKDIDVVGSFYQLIGKRSNKKMKMNYVTPEEIKLALLFSNPIANSTVTIRMETLKKYNLRYNSEYFVAQDYGMWAGISKVGKITILPAYLVKYRTGHNNITATSLQRKIEQRKKVIDSIHIDLLNYYGVDLSTEEVNIYNDFFIDFPFKKIKKEDLIRIPTILSKVEDYFVDNNIVQKDLFKRVLHTSIVPAISRNKLGLREKVHLYVRSRRLKGTKYVSDISYLVMKHLYNRLLRKA